MGVLIVIFIFIQLFGLLTFPTPAKAIVGAPDVVAALGAKWSWEKTGKALEAAALSALLQGASYFMRKLAYDAAMYVSVGGKGRSSLAFNQSAGAYFRDVALDSAADAINQFGKGFGLDLCKTPDIKLNVYLQIGLRNLYKDPSGGKSGPSPECDWQAFKNSWTPEAFENKYGPGGSKFLAQTFNNAIRVEQSDFGIALGAMGKIDRIKGLAEAGANLERLEGAGYKAVTSLISGKVKTPADVVREETKSITAKQSAELSASQVAGVYGSGALQIFPMAASVFLNTMTSQLLKRLMSWAAGLFSEDESGGKDSGVINFYSEQAQRHRDQKDVFDFLTKAATSWQLQSYPIIAKFAACPDDNPTLDNCVIDSKFQEAFQRPFTQPITIGEALKDGILHSDWSLISPRRVTDNTDVKGCYLRAYCYSNLQKLRKARILPLGFEIAALKASPDNPQDWTLGKVVAGFDDCAYSGDRAIPDEKHPFCHLIDPNWIIKSPDARCEANVNGPQLENKELAKRQEECADVSTRIIEEENPEKLGYYSYCLKEKNIWSFDEQRKCEPQYNTCQTYSGRAGKAVSYLARTLDYGECNSEAVGCRAYALEKDGERWKNNTEIDTITLKELGRPQTLFFNDKIKNYSCPDSADGCSAFNAALPNEERGDLLYFKKAPDYLGCYDIDISKNSAVIDWPETSVDLLKLAERPTECKKFAGACLKNEVGCEKYRLAEGGPDIPGKGGPDIPGIVGANSCFKECVGYDTYKQEETNFAPAEFSLYLIPNNGQSCQPQYAGCDEFTNIDELAKGGEDLEYYTDLRYCERPTTDNQKNYYSWEGDANQGYVLKVHKLMPISSEEANYIFKIFDNLPPAGFDKGSPAYADDGGKALSDNYNLCNEQKYNTLINNPYDPDVKDSTDCRALYDDQGKIYYRLLAQTVTVDNACHPLRKTETNLIADPDITDSALCEQKGGRFKNSQCERCYRGGKLDDTKSACIYWTISKPNESVSCPAAASGCRAYKGNAGNNVEEVLFTSFEPTDSSADALNSAKEGWTGVNVEVKIKPEAIQVGQYSLGVKGLGEAQYTFATDTLEKNEWYELSFWVRGDIQVLSVIGFVQNNKEVGLFTKNVLTGEGLSAPIGGAWQEYRLGPVQFTGQGGEEVKLVFKNKGGVLQYFLDNVRLTRLQGHEYKIKNSWKTAEGYGAPLACDADPTDAFPGEALGCRAYTDSRGIDVYATGFEKLCRPEAIGCQALYDTYNTLDEPEASAYNVGCEGQENKECFLKATVNGETIELGECNVLKGKDNCVAHQKDDVNNLKITLPAEVKKLTDVENARMITSTVFVPADTPVANPIYLTNRQEFNPNNICDNNLGCQEMALENYALAGGTASTSYEFSETYYKNNPEHYNDTLCLRELLGCEQFNGGNGVVFFKDPLMTGNSFCSYRPSVENKLGDNFSGWFREGVGKCAISNDMCRSDADCPSVAQAGEEKNKCDLNEVAPCYPDYLSANEYGLWSNKSEKYKGFVGLCPAEEDGCAELVDRADKETSQQSADIPAQAGKPYYVIYKQDLQNSAGECKGKVSLKEGCVLFDKTDQPNKLYDTAATYKNSEAAKPKYGFVPPVTIGGLDANIILKVNRNRQCGEWLACKSGMTVWGNDNKPQEICQQLGVCGGLLEGSGQCSDWRKSALAYINSESDNLLKLDEAYYVGRDVSWYGREYSGYSLFNQLEINNLTTVFSSAENRFYSAFAVKEENACDSLSKNDSQCGNKNQGRCYNKKCVYPADGAFPDSAKVTEDIWKYLEPSSCKMHPETDSPYPDYFVIANSKSLFLGDKATKYRYEFPEKKPDWSGANVCQEGDCSCEYEKVEYKNSETVDYWPLNKLKNIAEGICADTGENAGSPCKENNDCGAEGKGQCNKKKAESRLVGQRGFCLEPDLSRPLGKGTQGNNLFACLTWLPLNTGASNIDNYGYDERTGYLPALDASIAGHVSPGEVYCTEGTGRNSAVRDILNYNFSKEFFKWNHQSDYFYKDKINYFYYDDGINYYYYYEDNGEGQDKKPKCAYNLKFLEDKNSFGSYFDYLIAQAFGPGFVFRKKEEFGVDSPFSCVEDQNEPAIRARNLFPQGGANNPFAWLGREHPRKDDGEHSREWPFRITTKSLYTFMQMYGWYKNIIPTPVTKDTKTKDYISYIDTEGRFWQEPFSKFEGSTNFNTTVWYVDALSTDRQKGWGYFLSNHDAYKDIGFNKKVPTTEGDSGNEEWADWFYDGLSIQYTKRIPENTTRYYAIDQSKTPIYEGDIKRIYFVPFVYMHAEKLKPQKKDDYKDYLVDNVVIDFDDLERTASLPQNKTVKVKQYIKPYYKDLGETKAGEFSYFTFTGKIDWSNSNYDISDPSSSDNGLIYYRILVDLGNQIPAEVVKQQAQWYADHNTFVNWDIMKDKFPVRLEKVLYFDSKTRELVKEDDWGGFYGGEKSEVEKALRYAVGEGLPSLGALIEFRPRCVEYANVYDSAYMPGETFNGTNKAYTDRIWQYGRSLFSYYQQGSFSREEWSTAPYGPLQLKQEDLNVENNQENLRQYYFQDSNIDGFPYSCQAEILQGDDNKTIISPTLIDNEIMLDYSSLNLRCPGLKKAGQENNNGYVEVVENLPVTVDKEGDYSDYTKGVSNGRAFLNEFFIKAFQVVARTTDKREGMFRSDKGWDNADSVYIEAAPVVYSLNPFTCFGIGKKSCSAWKADAITVNRRNFGRIADTDYNGDGASDEDKNRNQLSDPMVYTNYASVAVNFFALAEDNHMPIRRIMMDWGDGNVVNERQFGFYHNYKPFCEINDSAGEPTLGRCADMEITCQTNDDCKGLSVNCVKDKDNKRHFGDSARACFSHYFEFSHFYTCSQADADKNFYELLSDEKEIIQAIGFKLNGTDKVCVFKPRVQVLDNWGWCSGGNYIDSNDSRGNCASNNDSAWTAFKGRIIVVPKK